MLDSSAEPPSRRMPRLRRTVEDPPSAPATKLQSTALRRPVASDTATREPTRGRRRARRAAALVDVQVFHAQAGQQRDQRGFGDGLPEHVLHDGLRNLLAALGLRAVAAGTSWKAWRNRVIFVAR